MSTQSIFNTDLIHTMKTSSINFYLFKGLLIIQWRVWSRRSSRTLWARNLSKIAKRKPSLFFSVPYLKQLLLILWFKWFHYCIYDSMSWAAGTGPGAGGASILIIAGSWDLFPAVGCASSWVACCVNTMSWAAGTRPGSIGPTAGPSATSWGDAEASLIELHWLYNWNVWYKIFNLQAIGPRSLSLEVQTYSPNSN